VAAKHGINNIMDHQTEFTLALSDAARQRRAAELLVREAASTFVAAERRRQEARGHRFSITRAVQCMSRGGLTDGIEAEIGQEMAMQAGRQHDPHRVLLPWGALMGERALIVGTGAQGGYLADGLEVTIGEALRGYSVAFDAGINTLSGLRMDVQIAQEVAAGTGYWLPELGTSTASEQVLGAATLSPKRAAGYVEVSRQLLKQSPGVDAFIGRSLRRTIGKLLDTAIISGTGTEQPLGFLNMSGLTVTTGTGLDHADLLAEQEAAADAYVTEANHKFVGSPDVRKLLSARAVGTAAGEAPFLWQDDKVLNRPAYATPAAGTGVIVHGDFAQALLGLWGPGTFELHVNPYAGFQAGIVGVRVLINCDLAVLNVGALRVISGIT
jgi:HK97 family phage major capsid protein